jgi:hypothetical protein
MGWMSDLAGSALVLGSLAMLPRAFAQEARSNTVQTTGAMMPRPDPGIAHATPGPVPPGIRRYTLPEAVALGGSATHGLWPVVVGNSDGNPVIEYQVPPR